MEVSSKTIFKISSAVVAVFLIIHYWSSIALLGSNIFKAFRPLIIGAVIAYLINILMGFYEKHYYIKKDGKVAEKGKKTICLLGSILTILFVGGLIIGIVVPQFVSCISTLINKLPSMADSIMTNKYVIKYAPENIYEKMLEYEIIVKNLNFTELASKLVTFLKSGALTNKSKLTTTVSSIGSTLSSFAIGIVFSIYFLSFKEKILHYLNKMVTHYIPEKPRKKVVHLAHLFNECFHKYIAAACLESLILGSLCFIGMTIFRFPYAGMISALVGLMELIPIVGGMISGVVGAFMILSESPVKALLYLVFLVVLQTIEGNLIFPKVVGKTVGAPGVIVFAAVTIGGSIFGIPGMMISVPAVTALYVELKSDLKRRDKLIKKEKRQE